MAQHKKKLSPHQNQKIVAAQYRNEFFRKMKYIIDTCCGANIFPLIPQKTLDNAYLCRCAPISFKTAYNSKVPNNILNDAKVVLSKIIRNDKFTIQSKNLEITLSEYYTVIFTIVTMHAHMGENDFNHATTVKEALNFFAADEATNEAANKRMYDILLTYGYGECDLTKCLVWFKHEIFPPKTHPDEIKSIIEINSIVPQTISVEVDGISRPTIRFGWAFAFEGPKWLSLKPSVFNIKSSFAEMPLDVYIQSHALLRLSERIDCFSTGIMHFNLYVSLLEPKVCYDSNNRILIEYRFFQVKAGYFRADIVNGVILLRTFLFITNNSTPEGQKLEKNTGLQKLDKKYLAIDKLSTFMTSDIGGNPDVRRIFKDAGCQCLIDLYEKMECFTTKQSSQFDANLMLNYLSYNTATTLETATNEALLESANSTI